MIFSDAHSVFVMLYTVAGISVLDIVLIVLSSTLQGHLKVIYDFILHLCLYTGRFISAKS